MQDEKKDKNKKKTIKQGKGAINKKKWNNRLTVCWLVS